MTEFLFNWTAHHQQFFVGAIAGYGLAHIPEAVCFVFHQAMRIPWFRAAILANPERAKKIVLEIERELLKDIDAEAGVAATAKATEPPKP